MQWTIEGTDGLTGPYPLLCESRQALTEALEEWMPFLALSQSRDNKLKPDARLADDMGYRRPRAIASNTVAKDIEGIRETVTRPVDWPTDECDRD